MKRHVLRVALLSVVAGSLSSCLVATGPPGEPVYAPPAVVVEPPVAEFHWGWWPHYEVEHHYVVDNERVNIRDRHYFPTYGRTRPYIQNNQGQHKGWYKHDGH